MSQTVLSCPTNRMEPLLGSRLPAAGLVAQSVVRLDGRRPVSRDDVPPDQVDQMRQHRASGGATQRRVQTDIKPLDHRIDGAGPRLQAFENPGFALATMRDKGADMPLRLGY